MSTSTLPLPRRRSARQARPSLVAVVVAGVLLLAVAGLVLAAKTILSPAQPALAQGSLPALTTSFGAVQVMEVHRLGGPTSHQLGGMTHGIPGLVAPGQAFIQVEVRIAAGPDASGGDYSLDQFAAQASSGKAVAPLSTSFPTGHVDPGMAVQGSLGFVVPVDTQGLSLMYQDPGNGQVLSLDLGKLPRLQTEPGGPEHRTNSSGSHHHHH